MQVEKTPAKNVFSFSSDRRMARLRGQSLDLPSAWRIEQHQLPCVLFSPERQITFGAATGCRASISTSMGLTKKANRGAGTVISSSPVSAPTSGGLFRVAILRERKMGGGFSSVQPDAGTMASECSVSYFGKMGPICADLHGPGIVPKNPGPNRLRSLRRMVSAHHRLSMPRNGARQEIVRVTRRKHTLPKGASDEMVISYVVNSFDFAQVVNDASLYWPRSSGCRWPRKKTENAP